MIKYKTILPHSFFIFRLCFNKVWIFVNAFHSSLKRWIKKFNGVFSTKFLTSMNEAGKEFKEDMKVVCEEFKIAFKV